MSNTSQPSSEAQRVRLSSRNRSDSLQERKRDAGSGQQVTAQSPSHPASRCWRCGQWRVRGEGRGPAVPQRWVRQTRSQARRPLGSRGGDKGCRRDTDRARGAATRHGRPSDLLGGRGPGAWRPGRRESRLLHVAGRPREQKLTSARLLTVLRARAQAFYTHYLIRVSQP